MVFGRHARLPVDWATGLQPASESHTLSGWVRKHQKALSHAYQTVQRQTQQRQELDQRRYDRRAKPAPLLPGERVLVRNFRRRAKGKLNGRWVPEPWVVVKQLRENHPVYLLRPEGKEAPTRTVHRNNLRPCPLDVFQDRGEPAAPQPPLASQTAPLPPPTWWLPGVLVPSDQQPAIANQDPAPAQSPEPPEGHAALYGETSPSTVRRSERSNRGVAPARYRDE